MAQPPQSSMYQSVIRNSSGTVLTNQRINAKVSILSTSASGTVVYEETHTATSDATGVLTLAIGTGTVVTGTFANIDWLADDYFLKTQIDPIGGSNYSLETTQQLLSVPYAFMSKKTTKLVGIDSSLASLDARLNRIDSLISVYNVQIRRLNDSIQTLANSPISPSQLQPLIQQKAKLESALNTLRNLLAATRNESSAVLPRQQAIITRSAGHFCDK